MTRVAIAMGANLGDRLGSLQAAAISLAALLGPVVISGVVETGAVGGPEGQPAFLNAVLVADTDLAADVLLARLHAIEAAQGRVREVHWGPRTLDLDLLAYDGLRSDDPALTLPHPRAHERAFVLVPWAEVDPTFDVPGRGAVADLLAALPARELAAVHPCDDTLAAGPA